VCHEEVELIATTRLVVMKVDLRVTVAKVGLPRRAELVLEGASCEMEAHPQPLVVFPERQDFLHVEVDPRVDARVSTGKAGHGPEGQLGAAREGDDSVEVGAEQEQGIIGVPALHELVEPSLVAPTKVVVPDAVTFSLWETLTKAPEFLFFGRDDFVECPLTGDHTHLGEVSKR
jgi:hypothetical protein